MTENIEAPISLPDKPSDLIELALADLREIERSRDYVVDMNDWHKGKLGRKCHVCLAGAVMARTLGVPKEVTSYPHHYQPDLDRKLVALDAFRCGEVVNGLEVLELPDTDIDRWTYGEVPIEPYEANRAEFHSNMTNLVAELREAGL